MMPIVTKIFYSSILRLYEHDKRMINFNSPIYNLLVQRQFDQSKDPDLILNLLALDDPYFEEYKEYCQKLKSDNDKQVEELKKRHNL